MDYAASIVSSGEHNGLKFLNPKILKMFFVAGGRNDKMSEGGVGQIVGRENQRSVFESAAQ